MMTPQNFVAELRRRWRENPAVAILVARLNPRMIPQEIVAEARSMQALVGMQLDIHNTVNAALGSMGIFGGGGHALFGGASSDDLFFIGTIAQVKIHDGEPPMAPALRGRAVEILLGRVDPLESLALAGSQIPGYGQLLQMMGPLIGDMAPMLRSLGIVLAALAVPRDEIAPLLGIEVEEDMEETDDAMFARALETAQHAITRQEFGQAEEHLVSALQIALETPSPNDDILAIDHLLLVAFQSRVSPESLKLCLRAVGILNERNSRIEELARITVALTALASGYGLSTDFDLELAGIGRSLLGKSIPRKQRLPLVLATAGVLHRIGESADAEEILADARNHYRQPNDQLDIAVLDADIHWDNGDREGATDLLVTALEPRTKLDGDRIMNAIHKLVCCWPEGREGIDRWLDALRSLASAQDEPQRTLQLLATSLALFRDGRTEQAAILAKGLDLDMASMMVPDSMKDMFDQISEAVATLYG